VQRIGGGRLRGRVLKELPSGVAGLRPTGARVRGAIFDHLQQHVHDARVLDLFGGSGALGFESLSRGARHLTLLDCDARVVSHLGAQARALGIDAQCTIERADAVRYLRDRPAAQEPFDLVFVDPPFATPEVFDPVVLLLAEGGWLAHNAAVMCESERVRGTRLSIAWPSGLSPSFSRAYGQAHVDIARATNEASHRE